MADEEKTTIEIAVVGPDTRCREEPNKAAMIGVTIAVYKPYCGGKPAMVANATPCGNTTTAPVSPAIKSFCKDCLLTSGSHFIKGKKRLSKLFNNK